MTMPFSTGFVVSSPYGERIDPINGEPAWHGGIDLIGHDTTVRAVTGGRVLRSRIVTDTETRTWEWGNYISIQGPDGLIYYYCHLDSRGVETGDVVEEGQPIGIMGATGRVTGPHLHFELRNSAGQVNPSVLLGIENRAGVTWKPEPAHIAQASEWAKDAVAWAYNRGILKGRGGDDFALQEPLTREEMCLMLYRAREVL